MLRTVNHLDEKARTILNLGNQGRFRVLCVDHHAVVREGISVLVNSQPDMSMVAQASNGREALDCFRKQRPDVTLMDLMLPDMCGIDAIVAIRAEFSEARIIVLTTFGADFEIQRALRAGVCSFLLKSMPPNEMLDTIRQVHAGKKRVPPEIAARLAEHLGDEPLTEREIEVLKLVMVGNRNRDVADHLFISVETVKAHMKHIMEKLSASDRTHAITIAAQRGIVQLWGTP
jgi:DNA-binding NarL/FixJ family response regulator